MKEPKKEPAITINGKVLSDGQALTLRMALGCLKLDLHEETTSGKLVSQNVQEHLKNLDELTELVGGLST